MGFKVEIKGLDASLKNIEKIAKQTEKNLNAELKAFGLDVVRDANGSVASDEGLLRNSISSKSSDLEVSIVANTDYAAYVEFGTRKFASEYVSTLPSDWQEYASKFRGAGGGSFDEFLYRLVLWVKRKGIAGTYSVKTKRRTGKRKNFDAEDLQAAYLIARKILRDGIQAKPFLYPAFRDNLPKLKERLKNVIK